MKGHKPSHIIRQIAETFPCLQGGTISCCFREGAFNPDILASNMRYWSHGEQQAARFVLTVWNRSLAKRKGWLFDSSEALAVWDMGNRAAYVAWCQNPIYP